MAVVLALSSIAFASTIADDPITCMVRNGVGTPPGGAVITNAVVDRHYHSSPVMPMPARDERRSL